MEAIFNQALTVAPVLAMVVAASTGLGVFLALAGNILSRELTSSSKVATPRCDLCFWHFDKV
ncbi:MAG: hypothetical protein GTO24_15515 [candidate division Zixibacteria bacterium]|nr:hypothetical protein [candidate division Zixibacteria bacterium]